MTQPCFLSAFVISLGLSLVSVTGGYSEEAGVAFYEEKVFPILKKNCFKCHGAEEKLKGNFRVTSREGLLLGGDYGPGLDEAEPAKSLFLEMVSYKDEENQMPPKAKLPDPELAILSEWIEMGAPYDPALEIKGSAAEGKRGFTVTDEQRNWWAYRPVVAPEIPGIEPRLSGFVDEANPNPIDAFILARIGEAGLMPNGPAEARPLVRRVFYDLIGLPPTPEEASEFEAAYAKDPQGAYEAVIEDLLARPQYGEKWARHWLDIVRYAESNGFERDNPKPEIWRYRDYVISALNQDTPYDQFVIEQLAGDEIAEPTRESLTATGFYRLMQWDDEPADRKQHVYDVLADNVLVTTETFLGMTVGCARCHDHKADPISQKDYYSFMAFFHGVTPYETPGTIRPWAEPDVLAKFEEDRAKRVRVLQAKATSLEAEMTEYLRDAGKLTSKGEERIRVQTFVDDARGTPATWSYISQTPAPGWKEVGTKVKNWFKAQGGFGTKNTPNTYVTTEWTEPEIWMRTDFGAQEIPETLVLELYHDEDVEVYLNGVEIYRATGFITDYQVIELGQDALDAFQTGKNVLAAHCKQTKGGQFIDMALRTGAQKPDGLGVALRRGGKRLEKELTDQLGRDVAKELRDTKNAINKIQREYPGTPLNVVKESGPKALPLQVHLRGSAHAPGEEVVPAFPSVLGSGNEPIPAEYAPVDQAIGPNSSGRRLALAKWIASPENPLTSRVIMNRLWQHHFGRGIVPSTNDFGQLGERPTHPELLTFLAAELIQRGWSLKEMHRLIMTSRTYRMSSAPNAENLLKDPQNNLFWRYNMRRLTAEELRDSMLSLSGKLNLQTGGSWVFPPLPKEVLATASKPGAGWPISQKEADHYRRSIYIHVKRSLRHQMLADFDQADTDAPCAVRFATTVPTQALTMLNSKFVNDQAALLAERLKGEPDLESQVRKGLSLTFQREPSADEVAYCVEVIEKFKGDHELNEHQALERFALLALNLNEFVYLD
ncbi:MAG: PSD1 and planctomycete cytochrome C domain-containing protein [Verrucomicrobiales bacterium]|nr:PSD1 and planctomycete cytochrome C domain-containing protein [Verrucomicrobiales bacterium]